MNLLEEARLMFIYLNSLSRVKRRAMMKKLKVKKWDKNIFPPYNKPYDKGIKKFKKSLPKNLSKHQRYLKILSYKKSIDKNK